MNYEQTLAYLFSQLPMYQRVGKAAYKADLSNTHLLCKLLGNPEDKFRSIHVAGTNGKGSTCHMLASILQEAGFRVGLYTSPHLKDFRERIKINGEMISEIDVISFVNEYSAKFEKINLSFFEWTVGLAFDYFSNQKVDVALIETGLGGRLDSTNVITPEVSIITNIGIDHTQFLGDTIEKIAIEKAGIIKVGIPVVIGETQEETKSIYEDKAKAVGSDIYFAKQNTGQKYLTDLKGIYQRKNIATCLEALKILNSKGWNISKENIKKGLLSIQKNTGLKGRWQILNKKPLTICDTGHNEAGMKEILNQISDTKYKDLHIVFGVVNDKSIENILILMPKSARYYFCEANIPRALDENKLRDQALKYGLQGESYSTVKNALLSANENASTNDLIFIGGSTFVVAEVL